MNYKVYVTKGELQTIMGFLDFGIAILKLDNPDLLLAGGIIPAQSIIKSLTMTNGIYLDNPEVKQLFDLLVYEGIIPDSCRKKVLDYIDQKLLVSEIPVNSQNQQVIPYIDWKINKNLLMNKYDIMEYCVPIGPLFTVNYNIEDENFWYYKICDAIISIGEKV